MSDIKAALQNRISRSCIGEISSHLTSMFKKPVVEYIGSKGPSRDLLISRGTQGPSSHIMLPYEETTQLPQFRDLRQAVLPQLRTELLIKS